VGKFNLKKSTKLNKKLIKIKKKFRPMIKTDLEEKIRYSEIRTHLFSL